MVKSRPHSAGQSTAISAMDAYRTDGPRAASPASAPNAGSDAGFDTGAIQAILESIEEVLYQWDLASDTISWSPNAASVLGVGDIAAISTGKKLAKLIDKESGQNPQDCFAANRDSAGSAPVAYRLQYALAPAGAPKAGQLWIEDAGCWYGDAAGNPVRACGALRVINERHEHEQRLVYLSRYDELTGQMNRTALVAALEGALNKAVSNKASAAFLIVAIDNLAMINAAYGFDVADDVIREVGARLRARMRGGDTIGRFSGNKFGMVLGNCRQADLETASNRLRSAVREEPVRTAVGPVPATVSIGAVLVPRYAQDTQKAMMFAQDALDQAKTRHRDSHVAYAPAQGIESARRHNIKIADSIISALNEGRVQLNYQPVFSSRTGEPSFYEGLLRMRSPEGRIITANNFIPAAEKLGLTRLLDHRVLDLAIQTLKARTDVTLALNISATTASDQIWSEHLHAQMTAFPGVAQRMIIEITETTAIHDMEESRHFIKTVKELGCRVAIDDFGAGYTSFRNLKMLDVDMVKIDGAFVENLSTDPDNQVFVRTLIELTRNFNIETVAEWVNSEEDAAMLVGWGADYLQGFLLGEASTEIPPGKAGTQSTEPCAPARYA